MSTSRPPLTHHEPHVTATSNRLNSLRAAVLGSNDGIVSTAGLVVGVAGAAASHEAVLTAGIAGIVAGALSMAAGEYVSVSSQRDSQKALLHKEQRELEKFPEEELEELTRIYEAKGLSRATAEQVARELSAKDAFAAHVDAEFGINPHDLTSPVRAAAASASAFVVGSLIPLAAIVLSPEHLRIPLTFAAVTLALITTGALSARAGGANRRVAAVRVVSWGVGAMLITYAIGLAIGTSL